MIFSVPLKILSQTEQYAEPALRKILYLTFYLAPGRLVLDEFHCFAHCFNKKIRCFFYFASDYLSSNAGNFSARLWISRQTEQRTETFFLTNFLFAPVFYCPMDFWMICVSFQREMYNKSHEAFHDIKLWLTKPEYEDFGVHLQHMWINK